MSVTPDTVSLVEDVLLPFGAVLFGGALSFLGTYFALNRGHKLDLERTDAGQRHADAKAAYAGFSKLMNAHNDIANAQREIDSAFRAAAEAGASEMEPWAKVKIMVSREYFDDPLTPDETGFLIASGNAELLNRAQLIQRRCWNVIASRKKYNELRESMDAFLIESIPEISETDGTTLRGELTGKHARVAELYGSKLNNLLGQIMAQLETDEPESFEVASQFKAAATKHFGDAFPSFKFGKSKDDAV